MPSNVAVVTDSTCSLDETIVERLGIVVVPLQVVIGAEAYDEALSSTAAADGSNGATPELIATALREWTPVTTSRPAPARLLEVYEELAASGVEEIVSVHLSGEMSGTLESAQLAAREASVPVHVVDSRQVGIGTGYAVLAAAAELADGADATAAAETAARVGRECVSLFYVDTLEYLRRGGRVGFAAALFGSALAVKPLLTISDGRVAPLEKVRTSSRALARLENLAVEAVENGPEDALVRVTVAHLANQEAAAKLAEKLDKRLCDRLVTGQIDVGQVGAVLGAHVGPGMVAVCVSLVAED